MSAYDPAIIRAALKAILEAVTSVQVVYDYRRTDIQGDPAVVFDLASEDASILDDANNQRILNFKIWIITSVPTTGENSTKDRLDVVTKDVINALESLTNMTVGGTADWTMPVIGPRDQIESPEGNIAYQELSLKVYVVSDITA